MLRQFSTRSLNPLKVLRRSTATTRWAPTTTTTAALSYTPLRLLCGTSTLPNSQESQQQRAKNSDVDDDDDDFIDVDCLEGSDALAGMLEEDEQPMMILGVTRIEAEKEDEKKTRLGATVRMEERYRSGSRAYNNPLSEVDGDAIPYVTTGSGSSTTTVDSLVGKGAEREGGEENQFVTDEEMDEGEEEFKLNARDGRTVNGDLPFDDVGMAEAILRMEVEGQIDETWQDSRKSEIADCREIVSILKHMKVRDVACIQTSTKTGSFDFIIMGTCEGSRHLNLCAWAVCEADKEHRISKVTRRKADNNWEVIPVGRIVVNLMIEALRSEMSLERKWAVTKSMDPLDSANAPISEGRQVKAHGLWTLTLNLQDLEDFEVDYCKDALLSQL